MDHDYELSVSHVDTCLSCYVMDHCNGDDEMLIGVPVDRSSRMWNVRDDLISEMRADCSEKIPEGITDEMVKKAIRDRFRAVHPFRTFDAGLDPAAAYYDGESAYAWFRFDWINPENEEA